MQIEPLSSDEELDEEPDEEPDSNILSELSW